MPIVVLVAMPGDVYSSDQMSHVTDPLVLVVDDYQDAREMYAQFLTASGFRTVEARSGVEAVGQGARAEAALHPHGPVAAGYRRMGGDAAAQGRSRDDRTSRSWPSPAMRPSWRRATPRPRDASRSC